MNELFEGQYESYVEALDVKWRSTTKAVFRDLTLPLFEFNNGSLKPIKSMHDAIRQWGADEYLDDLYNTDDPDANGG